MKKTFLSIIAAIAFTTPLLAHASDPCATVLCLSTISSVPSQCASHVADYFSIRVFVKKKKKKVFSPEKTAKKRAEKLLEECEGAPANFIAQITSTYGPLEKSPFSFYEVGEGVAVKPTESNSDNSSTSSSTSNGNSDPAASTGTTAEISDYLLVKPFGNTAAELEAEYAEIYALWEKAEPIATKSRNALNTCHAQHGLGNCSELMIDNLEKSGLAASYRFRLDRINTELQRLH